MQDVDAAQERDPAARGAAARGPAAPPVGPGPAGDPARRRRAFLLAVVPVAVLAVAVAVLRRYPPNSDAAAQQSIILTWLHTGHDRAYLPPDTWLLKFPLYAAVESLPLASVDRLVLEAALLNAAMYLLLGGACWWFAGTGFARTGGDRRWSDVALPLAWLATLGGGLGRDLSTGPNFRNVELGLAFVLLAAAARYVRDGSPARRAARAAGGGAAAAVLALLWADDPYFLVLVGLPLLAVCLAATTAPRLLRALRGRAGGPPPPAATGAQRRRLLHVAAVVAVSLPGLPLLRALLDRAGITVVDGGTTVTLDPDVALAHLRDLWPALTSQLRDRSGPGTAGFVASLALGAVAVGLAGLLARRAWHRREALSLFVALHWPVVVAAVVVKRDFEGSGDGRYLVLGVVDLVVCTCIGLAVVRRRRPRLATALTAVVAAAVVTNVAVRVAAGPADPAAFPGQAQTLAALRASGATKGFAHYWAANLYVHQSAGELQLSEVACTAEGRLQQRRFLTDTARAAVPARRTVVLHDPAAAGFAGCPRARVDAQLGAPAAQLPAAGGAVVLVYDRDVTGLLDPAP